MTEKRMDGRPDDRTENPKPEQPLDPVRDAAVSEMARALLDPRH